MTPATALLISTDEALIRAVKDAIAPIRSLEIEISPNNAEAIARIGRDETALVLIHEDGSRPRGEIDEFSGAIRSLGRPVPWIVIGERDDAQRALELMRLGVVDYLSRPLDLGRLAFLADMLTMRARLAGPAAAPSAPPARPGRRSIVKEPVGGRPKAPMDRIMEQVRRVAPRDATILLGGETGTGKTRMARIIHDLSPRRDEPFLAVNCGALSETLIESELFGHVRGAFTGADRDRVGKFAAVGRGTLFLDEVDALPPATQAKLLRVVEERLFEPVGSNQTHPMQARIVAASNRDLAHEADAGRFRSDLYYRLAVISFTLPRLRERTGAIAPLVRELVSELGARAGCEGLGVSGDAMRALDHYGWPGNIRELRNVIERATALCCGAEIGLDDLPEVIRQALPKAPPPPTDSPVAESPQPPAQSLAETREEVEISRIKATLARHNNNRLRAAADLGISRMTLYKKLHRYSLMDLN